MNPQLGAVLFTTGRGAILGAMVLGIGGRLAMHAIAQINSGTGRFTLGGTLTVIALGAASGALAGGVLAGIRVLVRRRRPPLTTALFWTFLIAITVRGLGPLNAQRLALFLPLIVLFGVWLQWMTWPGRRRGGPDQGEAPA